MSVKTAPWEFFAHKSAESSSKISLGLLELQIQAGCARGSSIPPWLPSSQDTLSEILPPSPIPGTDVGTGRSTARCSGPSPRPAKRHQGCPDKGAEFSHPKNSPRTVLSSATCHELHFFAKSGGKRGKDLSCTTPLPRSFILSFFKKKKNRERTRNRLIIYLKCIYFFHSLIFSALSPFCWQGDPVKGKAKGNRVKEWKNLSPEIFLCFSPTPGRLMWTFQN